MIINIFGYILSGFWHFFRYLMKNGLCRSSGKKYAKMVLFGLKTHFEKNFLGYFYPPTLPMHKTGSKWSLNRFLKGVAFKAPPTRCLFQRPLLVGLIKIRNAEVVIKVYFYKSIWIYFGILIDTLKLINLWTFPTCTKICCL